MAPGGGQRQAAAAPQLEHRLEHQSGRPRCPRPPWRRGRGRARRRPPAPRRSAVGRSGRARATARRTRGRRRAPGRGGRAVRPRRAARPRGAAAGGVPTRAPPPGRSREPLSDQSPSATPPVHASAVSPIGGTTIMAAVAPPAAATQRPQGRSRARMPNGESELLEEADRPFRRQCRAQHLEGAREHPQAARTVEVQEVAVGHLPVEHQLREDEHEALLHRGAGCAPQLDQGQQAGEHHDPHRQQPRLRRGEDPTPGRGRLGRQRLRLRPRARFLLVHGVGRLASPLQGHSYTRPPCLGF